LGAVTRGGIQAIVTSTGRVEPLNTVKVGSQVSGNIKEIYADFNSPVNKGQVIALIDPAIYSAEVDQAKAHLIQAETALQERQKDIVAARAGVESAEARRASARATLKEARLNYDRLENLGKNRIVAKSELDSALAKLENAKGAMEEAEAKVRTSRAQLGRAIAQEKGAKALIVQKEKALRLKEIKLEYCTITSPIDGIVISRDVDVGQTVAATLQSPVLFTIAEDLKRMQVEVDVSEADVGRIKPGQEVEFNVDSFPEEKFRARVRQVRNFPTDIQNVVTYKIIADVDNDSLMLRPGMTANVSIVVAEVDDVLKVPNSALRFKPPGEIREAKQGKGPPIRERRFFKEAVKKVGLDSEQADEFVEIIEEEGSKLKQALSLPEEERDPKEARRSFLSQVFKRLFKILRQDQHAKLMEYTAELRAFNRKRMMYKGRWTEVYMMQAEGRAEALKVMAGITNDTETQIIQGPLKEGDQVIVGLNISPGDSRKSSSNLFMSIFKRR
jgi:HlyD family secretion protein